MLSEPRVIPQNGCLMVSPGHRPTINARYRQMHLSPGFLTTPAPDGAHRHSSLGTRRSGLVPAAACEVAPHTAAQRIHRPLRTTRSDREADTDCRLTRSLVQAKWHSPDAPSCGRPEGGLRSLPTMEPAAKVKPVNWRDQQACTYQPTQKYCARGTVGLQYRDISGLLLLLMSH
ncbi:Hypothetical predicted protein [Pelobates cultripes]|uniref:Uncharacterized protein n=1 Tax=Pelobates cultripes TaxID=61616 RepID=A0AAD1W7D8_PELCU|nr:Hypothetical predicted protein [Pelobates cultripes]